MKSILGSLALLCLSYNLRANTVSLSCLKQLTEIEDSASIKIPNLEERKLISLAMDDVAKRNKNLVEYFKAVRSDIKELKNYYSSTKRFGVEIEYCDSTDYAQANCYSYLYTSSLERLNLIAIYDIPHSGAEETVQFICE